MLKLYFLLFIFVFFCACSSLNNFEKVKLISIYDGDTFKVNLPCKEKLFCQNIPVRVSGIDTPELKTKNFKEKQKAEQAKNFTEQLLLYGQIILRNCKRDKYFRMICDVFIIKEKEEINLAEKLISSGLAIRYDGKTKTKNF